MRVLNTKDINRKYSKFSMPGFRSGSLIKRMVALFYYIFILAFTVNSIRITLSGDFGSGFDIFLAVVVELLIVSILLVPVLAIGFSDHYDWHGIKLFLIIMFSWCVLFTAAQFVSTMFSKEFINSTISPANNSQSISSDASYENNTEIDKDVIIDNIDTINEENSSLTK